MLGPLIAIAFGYWYFRTARAQGEPPWKWAFVGALAFWLPEIVLSNLLLVAASPLDVDTAVPTMVGVFALSFTAGGITAYAVRERMLVNAAKQDAHRQS